jgi:hypothetical protein
MPVVPRMRRSGRVPASVNLGLVDWIYSLSMHRVRNVVIAHRILLRVPSAVKVSIPQVTKK